MQYLWLLFAFFGSLISSSLFAAANTTQVNVLSYAGTNVTTSAYVQLVASSPVSVSRLQVCDTSTKLLKIATGAAGFETDRFTVQISGCVSIPYYFPPATRFSIKAIDASATTGYNTLSFLP
jgi:hypothetical protein